MSTIVDFHTHAFPDDLAPSALEKLEASSGTRAFTSGTVDALLGSMDRAGISRSVVHSVATSPKQADPIRLWSLSIRSDRILPFPSVHPDSSSLALDLLRIADDGFLGIKLHPLYRDDLHIWFIIIILNLNNNGIMFIFLTRSDRPKCLGKT